MNHNLEKDALLDAEYMQDLLNACNMCRRPVRCCNWYKACRTPSRCAGRLSAVVNIIRLAGCLLGVLEDCQLLSTSSCSVGASQVCWEPVRCCPQGSPDAFEFQVCWRPATRVCLTLRGLLRACQTCWIPVRCAGRLPDVIPARCA